MQTIRDGQSVTGTYCGVKYQGVVLSSRMNEARRSQIIYTVGLDEAITVYGQKRIRIMIEVPGVNAFDPNYNTIEVR